MKVCWVGPVGHCTGYGQASNFMCDMLLRAGVDLTIVAPTDVTEAEIAKLDRRYLPLLDCFGTIKDPDVVVAHAVPFGVGWLLEDLPIPGSTKRISCTTWESESLPGAAVEVLDTFDQTWWPSRYNAEAHKKQARFPDRARVLPHAFDPEHWPSGTPSPNNELYTFYQIFTWCERKNPMGLLKAYLTEFGPDDKVLLKLRTPGYLKDDIDALVRGLKLNYLPPVEMLCEYVDEAALLNLHLSSDCYVTSARSEGFGLGAFEAALVGNHVIAPRYSGLLDFLENRWNVSLVDYFFTPVYTPETVSNTEMVVAGLKIKPVTRNDHLGLAANQNWAEPNLHQMKAFMRAAYENRYPRTTANRAFLEDNFSYQAVSKKMMSLLNEVLSS